MPWDVSMTNLRSVLTELFPSIADAQRIVDVAGLPSSHIAYNPAALTNWHSILTEAMKRQRIPPIIDAALQEYPESKELQLARSEYGNLELDLRSEPNEQGEAASDIDVAVITPLPVEWYAIAAHLVDSEPIQSNVPTVVGKIGRYRVLLRMPYRTGNYAAADLARSTANEYAPRWIALVGVAGGFPDEGIRIGDVVVASHIYAYEYGKIHLGTVDEASYFQRRQDYDFTPDQGWLAHIRLIANAPPALRIEWTSGIKDARPDGQSPQSSNLHVGPTASGDKVVDDPSYEFFDQAISSLPGLFAVEMEAAGVGAVTTHLQAERQIGFLMIRGVSDTPRSLQNTDEGKPRGTEERDSWKPYAAAAAAAFLEYLLSRPGSPPSHEDSRSARVLKRPLVHGRRPRSESTHLRVLPDRSPVSSVNDQDGEVRTQAGGGQPMDRKALFKEIDQLLEQNWAVFEQFGPQSLAARENPLSGAPDRWARRKQEVIIPNNRQICEVVEQNASLFNRDEYRVFLQFREHAEAFQENAVNRLDRQAAPEFPPYFRTIVESALEEEDDNAH